MKKFLKTVKSNQKVCLITLLSLIVITEILIRIDNRVVQTFGICIVPFIILLGFQLILNDQKKADH